MIIERKIKTFDDFSVDSFVSTEKLIKLLKKRNNFKDELLELFEIDTNKPTEIHVGNAKSLIDSLIQIDEKCEKIDLNVDMKDIHLQKMLKGEKAIFEIFSIDDEQIINKIKSDKLTVETRYSSKMELLDYFQFNRFANYCRDREYYDLIDVIKDYLNSKNQKNQDQKSIRLVEKFDNNKFYLRAITSTNGYKDFGLNFSVFVALMSLDSYTKQSGIETYISSYFVDESSLYVTFALNDKIKVDDNLEIMFELILENDEIKRNSVSFNGMFKLIYSNNKSESEIFIKPRGYKKENKKPTDLLTYQHRGKVENVLNDISELPKLIDFYIEQVCEDAQRITKFQNPDHIRRFLSSSIKRAQKTEFLKYKDKIYKKLINIKVDNTFKLFELLREVEELFETEDIVSRDYWRTRIYEAMINGK
ncbi:hypothetical protein [Marinifilum fragile]|uniref:hypothetical protein n=1 Tax=Marinifilum fragile TaxID=570161 RepID=UPI0006D29629|nr:hypothetical protein [Marinifilum fragile]